MKIGYFKQIGEDYEFIYPKGKKISVMNALIEYMKKQKVSFEPIQIGTPEKELKKYDYIFVGFNLWKLYIYSNFKKEYNAFLKYSSLKQLSHPVKLVKIFENKCKIHKLFNSEKNIFPALRTSCISASNLSKQKLDKLVANKTFFLKPNPGVHSSNVRTYKQGNMNIDKYVSTVKQKYDGIIAQRYVNNFATKTNPEYRCIIVGDTISHVVCTVMDKTTRDHKVHKVLFKTRIPKILTKYARKIIPYLEKKYKFHNLYCRIDFGKVDGSYFINEIEILPGIFSEHKFSIIKQIGDRIIEIAGINLLKKAN